MQERRFLLSSPPQANQTTLSGEEAHHLLHVLRAKLGDSVELIDGKGGAWRGKVAEIRTAPLAVTINQLTELPRNEDATLRLTLIQSLCKTDKLEWILEKTTELGISEIRLLAADRSVLKLPEHKIEAKLERWNKIIVGAAKQSRRSTLPLLFPPANCVTICRALKAELKLVFSTDDSRSALKDRLRQTTCRSAAFCVGPEGGWTPAERETFLRCELEPVTLGLNILRTETAAIVGTAILKYELESPDLKLTQKSCIFPLVSR